MTGPGNHSELIDSYLSGNMNSTQQAEFEIMLESDPLLKEEFNFQQDIVGGLKEFRKEQLKTRLNQVTVGVGVTGALMNYGSGKLIAAVGALGLMGVGTYYFLTEWAPELGTHTPVVIEQIDTDVDSPTELTLEKVILSDLVFETEDDPEEKSNSTAEKTLIKVKTTKQKASAITSDAGTKSVGENKNDKPVLAVVKADFVVPSFDDLGSDEETLDGIDIVLPEVRQSVTLKEESSKVEIENITETKYDLHYKFFEGRLYLYGDFNEIPYELLEINNGSSRTLYLFHDEVYYKVSQLEQEIVPLEKINDDNLIEDLEIIRKSKK